MTPAPLLSMDFFLLVFSRLSSRVTNVPPWCEMETAEDTMHAARTGYGNIQDVSLYFLLSFVVHLEVL